MMARTHVVRRTRALTLVLALVASLLAVSTAARAEDGDTLRTFTADVPHCSINTGIAFDGEALYLSCWGVPRLYRVSAEDGSRLATIDVPGVRGMGALAWDATRNAMWVCDSSTQSIYLVDIDGNVGTTSLAFRPTGGCIDGLAFDGTDDTLFTSGDVASTVYHWKPDGTLIDSRYVRSSLGGCGSSGIAVGGGDLFLANNGCSAIYRASNHQAAVPQYFASFDRRIEDLECDDVTFAGEGKAAIWAQDAYDAEIHAFELNVGDCGFGGLPPGDEFVYVAFGDSYQSGEGAGNSIDDTERYLAFAYEDGANFPERLGAQQDTYIPELGGDACHRALNNYAKLNRDRLEPGARVVLVDVTCSGAQIQPAGHKPPIVGTMGEGIAPDSQVQQALDRLRAAGYGPEDVDLVTVGMGGNDAGFGDIVAGCLLPNLLRQVIERYPDAPGEISFLADRLSCQFVDTHKFKTGPRIEALPAKERFGQREILGAFPQARVLQLNYPDVLPHGDVPEWCGGLAAGDVTFAREKITAIDAAIAEAVADVGDPRLELVDIEDRFGRNALCPAGGTDPLANGFAKRNVDAEIRRLLNLDGNGDAEMRAKLDRLVEEYRTWRACLRPFGCKASEQWDVVVAAWDELYAYAVTQTPAILANAIEPPGPFAEDQIVRFDRSRGLFHPNAKGFEVMACNVRATYLDGTPAACLADPNFQPSTIQDMPFGMGPILAAAGDLLEVRLRGYEGNTPIYITYHSETVELGTVTTDDAGEAVVQIEVPDVGPGVHRLRFSGTSAGGMQLVQQALIEVPGDPVPGQPYGIYQCGFDSGTPDDGVIEYVDIATLGIEFTEIPDHNGCIYLDLPLPDDPAVRVEVVATSQLTGETVSQVVVEGVGTFVDAWDGTIQPAPAWNTAKAGRAVPIDFRLVDREGLPVDDASVIGLESAAIDCDSGERLGDVVAADDAGYSSLRSNGDGWWRYNWKTDWAWSGSCRTFTVVLEDLTRDDLWFSLR